MPTIGTVNYHVHKPERQAFEIDAGGISGNLVSPELAPTDVALTDLRGAMSDVSFQTDGFAFRTQPSRVSEFPDGGDWATVYDGELTDLLRDQIGAQEVVVFDHTVRIDDPNAARRPARNVHSDYSQDGAEQRLVDILGKDRAAEWAKGRYAFINIWRPVENAINSAPLGFVRPSSVAEGDWILLDLIYADRKGSILGLAANPDHDWVYLSRMTPEEVAYFNIYDSSGRPSVGHSAIDLIEDPNIRTIRKSIESRTLVRF